jgi:1-acyl-sn-glycerol-3-phosphate acyltransferase
MDWRRFDPSWARRPLARIAREGILRGILGAPIEYYTQPRAVGLELFNGLKPPAIFIANHSSHLDTPTILRSLPKDWRTHTATIAAADYFYKNRIVASLVTLSFATIPIERGRGGLSKLTSERLAKLLNDQWNMLLYPEGTRSRNGKLGRMRSGAAFLAVEHSIPIVPIYLRGTHDSMPVGRPWPRKYPVTVFFGRALYPAPGEDHRSLTLRVERALRQMRDDAQTD